MPHQKKVMVPRDPVILIIVWIYCQLHVQPITQQYESSTVQKVPL